MLAGVVVLLVHPHDDRDVLVLRGRGDDDLLGPSIEVQLSLLAVGEHARRLDDDLGPEVAPGQFGGVALGEGLDLFAVNANRVFGGRYVAVERAIVAVVHEEVSQSVVVGQVVDRHNLYLVGIVVAQRLEHLPPDTAEPVDPHFHDHSILLLVY